MGIEATIGLPQDIALKVDALLTAKIKAVESAPNAAAYVQAGESLNRFLCAAALSEMAIAATAPNCSLPALLGPMNAARYLQLNGFQYNSIYDGFNVEDLISMLIQRARVATTATQPDLLQAALDFEGRDPVAPGRGRFLLADDALILAVGYRPFFTYHQSTDDILGPEFKEESARPLMLLAPVTDCSFRAMNCLGRERGKLRVHEIKADPVRTSYDFLELQELMLRWQTDPTDTLVRYSEFKRHFRSESRAAELFLLAGVTGIFDNEPVRARLANADPDLW